jgi:hypothetical protein
MSHFFSSLVEDKEIQKYPYTSKNGEAGTGREMNEEAETQDDDKEIDGVADVGGSSGAVKLLP